VAAVLPACMFVGAVGLTGCDFPIIGGDADAGSDANAAPAASTPSTGDSTVDPAQSPATATTAPAAPDAGLVAACVEFVQFQAYVGNSEGVDIWVRAGQTVEGLDRECRSIVISDGDLAEQMRSDLEDLKTNDGNAYGHDQGVGNPHGTEVIDAASTTLMPGCHPSYGGCLPIVSDIDCVRDRGSDGPIYQGLSVLVLGVDDYDLDRDGDGLACEPGDR
jgi:hypothetical protein